MFSAPPDGKSAGANDRSFWVKLGVQLFLVWALIFSFYELVERIYLQHANPQTIHLLHILRGGSAAFLLAILGARGVYRRRETFIVATRDRLAAEKFRQDEILSELGAGLVVLDTDFRVTYANAQAQKWLGSRVSSTMCDTNDCALGQSVGLCPAREATLRRGRVSFEEKVETRDGVRHLYITATPLPAADGEASGGIIELIQDVTAMKQMEARLRQSLAAARTGAIASGIAHQLGNPLSAISAAVERLHSLGAAKQEAYARYLQRIEIESDRAAKIVRALMELARRVGNDRDVVVPGAVHDGLFDGGGDNGSGQRRYVPTGVKAEIIESVRTVTENRGRLLESVKLLLPETDLYVRVGVTELREVLVNLLENAMDATSRIGGQRISVHAAQDKGSVILMVCDNGPGIENSLREKIFEPFVTTRPDGAGLGLYLCREIVESYGGEISADNLPTGGARFLIRLPAAAGNGRDAAGIARVALDNESPAT